MSRVTPSYPRAADHKFEQRWQLCLKDYVTAIAWSPDGQHLAASSAQGEVVLGHPANPPHGCSEHPEGLGINDLAFSTDSQFLAAVGQSGRLEVWSSTEQTQVLSQQLAPVWLDVLAWHPSLPILAVGVGPDIQIWDISRQVLIQKLNFSRSSVLALAWHPQGHHLAVSGHGGVSVWSATDWDRAPEFIAVPGASITCGWSPDGRYLGSGNLDHTLTVVDWGNPPPWFMQGFPGKVRQIAWSDPLTKTGSPLLAAACMSGITIWERERNIDGVWRNRVLEHHQQTVQAIAFQPQTFTLASAAQDGKLLLWRQAKAIAQVLSGSAQGWSTVAWSPKGRRLAAGGEAGELVLWSQRQPGKGFRP
ncbi:MAG: WD40 repeat domain-containing protein [Spirulina sp. SIO3F2]|nr:WD40 repeat domain-containing protein [Spirulina sp. SIO3F2]